MPNGFGVNYTVIIEKAGDNYSAYVPDLPGCVAAADTPEEVLELMQEAIEFHLEGLRRDGDPVPPPQSAAGGYRKTVERVAQVRIGARTCFPNARAAGPTRHNTTMTATKTPRAATGLEKRSVIPKPTCNLRR